MGMLLHPANELSLLLVTEEINSDNHAIIIDVDDGGLITSNLDVGGRVDPVQLET